MNDIACFNCEACLVIKIPAERSKPESMYQGLCSCKQKLSDHHRHIVGLNHVCAWHSDSVSKDSRFPHWKETIDE